MNRIHHLMGLVAVLAMTVTSTPAGATGFDEIVFFGDSLTDTGNVWYATGGFPPSPYFQGTSGLSPDFTGGQWSSPEGPSWPTPFASEFGLTATPSVVGGNNYAWGGARTGTNPDSDGTPWLDQQVGEYLEARPPTPGTLISIFIGGNDVANNLGDPEALEAGITSITTQITNLYDQGARQFLVPNVPDIGATPEFQMRGLGIAAFATLWTIQWNTALATALGELSMLLPEAVISSLDVFALGKDPEVLSQFANTTDACLTLSSICGNPASYFYWDSFHPSSTTHALIAEAQYQITVPGRLQELLADVTGVGPGKSLEKKVASAHDSFAAFRIQATCGKLTGFMNQVMAQAGKKLTDAQATEFLSDAQAITEAIGCD